jgi:hypothetical protein
MFFVICSDGLSGGPETGKLQVSGARIVCRRRVRAPGNPRGIALVIRSFLGRDPKDPLGGLAFESSGIEEALQLRQRNFGAASQRFDFESSSDNFEEGTHMIFGQRESNSYFAAIFSYDFLDEGLGYETIARIHRGEICEWIRDLEASGLFSAAEVHAAELAWRENPRLLLDALLEDADEVSVKRWEIAWTRLERQSPAAGTAVAEHG